MPFTGSHPAAILPLVRTPLPASALVIGSMAPDFPYYVPYVSGPTHSALGIVTIDLLLGLAGWLVWHAVLAAPALAAAPTYVRRRLSGVEPGLRRRLGNPALVVLALVIGSATHVGWDEFTHPGRFGPQHLTLLARTWHGMPGWHWAQYASTVGGGVVLLVWLARWLRQAPERPATPTDPRARWSWFGLLVITAAAGGVTALTSSNLRAAAFRGATHGAGAALAAALVLAVGWQLAHRVARQR